MLNFLLPHQRSSTAVFSNLNDNTMKKPLFLSPGKVWTGSLIAIGYFLLAACMQHDESLSPRNHHAIDGITTEANEIALAMKRTFTAHLNSENETSNVESTAQGQAIFTLSKDGTVLHYKLIVANIKNVSVAHIHCGAAEASGPPIAFLFEGAPADVNGILEEGEITEEDIIDRSAAACGGVAVSTFDDLVARLRNGTAYVNVHTSAYPGGEVRGQIK